MASKHVVEINEENFEREVLQSETPVLVDFSATWCGPCKLLSPVVDELAAEASGRFKVAKLDIDEAPGVATRYGVRSVPTVIAFRGGQQAGRHVGVTNKRTLLALLSAGAS